jgi:antitoxin component of RelBE/YafQ-DinJ toxin-antitoxin module
MNITLSVDEKVAEEARKAAQAMGKSLNQAVRDYLEQLAGRPSLEAELDELRQLAMQGKGSETGWKFDREELYAERLDRYRGA